MKIFLSYRRSDRTELIDRLRAQLSNAFGESNVFFDEDSIPAGADFRSVLRGRLMRADCLLAIIGPTYVSDRLQAPDDYVRFEVATALSLQLQVVPLLIDGAAVPVADSLPPDMAQLAYRNAMRLRNDPQFDADVARLIQALELTPNKDEDDDLPRTVVVGLPIPVSGTAVSSAAPPGGLAPPTTAPPQMTATPPVTATPAAHSATAAHTATTAGRSIGKFARFAIAGGVTAAAVGGAYVVATRNDDTPSRSITTEAPAPTTTSPAVVPVITATDAPDTTPADAFPVNLGDTITPDQPAGAGHLETPGGQDSYTMPVRAGQAMWLPIENPAQCKQTFVVTLVMPDGITEFNHGNCSLDDRIDFPESGTATIKVGGGDDNWTGTYELELEEILGASGQPDDHLQIEIGSSVAAGRAPGGGQIETSGSHDVYQFAVRAGQSIWLPIEDPARCTQTFVVNFVMPDGTTKFNHGNCSLDDRIDFPEAGTATIDVSGGDTGWTGAYQLDPSEILGTSGQPDDRFRIDVGSKIGPDRPAGAGHIETPGSYDLYTLTVTAGQSIFLPAPTGPCTQTHTITITQPDGSGAGIYGNCSLDKPIEFTRSGEVTIQVSGVADWTGTYELEVAASGG